MTPAEAMAFRAGLEAAAKLFDDKRASALSHEGREAFERLAREVRALPVPAAVEPDFGTIITEHDGVALECKAIAPGLSMHDLVVAFEDAEKQAAPGDELSANPSKWPTVRGVTAVRNAIINAIYGAERRQE